MALLLPGFSILTTFKACKAATDSARPIKECSKTIHSWRGGRAVDGTGLENRHTRKGIGGSNPSLSARISKLLEMMDFYFRLP